MSSCVNVWLMKRKASLFWTIAVVSSSRLALPVLTLSSGRLATASSRRPTVPKPEVVPTMMKPLLALVPPSHELTIPVTSTET